MFLRLNGVPGNVRWRRQKEAAQVGEIVSGQVILAAGNSQRPWISKKSWFQQLVLKQICASQLTDVQPRDPLGAVPLRVASIFTNSPQMTLLTTSCSTAHPCL
jgi:hypothetical protein